MASRILSGRYELLEKIGDGGMAVVYKGKDRLLNRYIAVKILRPEFTKDATFVENFKRESQAAAGLSHPNIVGVYDVGREGNINYIVMELIEGDTLNKIIEKEAPMDYRKVIDISKQVASALRIAHKNKIIHRDVKPHNIMVTNDGVVKLADFGIARAVNDATLSTGSKIVGSVHYFSPEQARGNYVDERSDIYSLGIVMYEMLTGKVPFDGDNPVTVALKHINEEIIPPRELEPSIPPALERIVMKATNKFQTNRYANADELIQDLDNVSFVTAIAPDSIFESTTVVEKRNKRKQDLEKDIEEVVEARERDRKRKRRKAIAIATVIILLISAAAGGYIAWRMGVFSSTKAAPDLLDKTYDNAKEIAEAEGFKVKKGKDIYSSEYAEGRVCQQDPQPGVEMPKEGTITINVSKGNKEGLVPSVVGMNQDDVEAFLKTYGYELGNVKTVTSHEDEGEVLEQIPVAGTTLDKESAVDIVVSDGKGLEKGIVPSVTRMSLKEAKKAIEAAGFQVGNITYDWDSSIGKGYVIYQQYQANSQLDKGTAIDLQVSSGKEPDPEEPVVVDDDDDNDNNADDESEVSFELNFDNDND
ncbi:MAG: Stk1 family PASTA domain-containing Ser/Thr kinase [Mogibacterium sp.]|nr:Stk1 family PASTA domain-containing Ser/Thr kinase [Mogibacterium sp.]MBR0341605.1 Stk1 family PASTA domain-containing Ser/Thr kinase [Oscillospiraceae bacterium]